MENGKVYIKMQVSDVLDRYTILKIKLEKGQDCESELKIYQVVAEQYDKELTEKLYQINKSIWPLHEELLALPDSGAGRVAKYLLSLNSQRGNIKDEIVKKYGGFEEKKTYA